MIFTSLACNYSAYHETAYLEAGNETDMLWENHGWRNTMA